MVRIAYLGPEGTFTEAALVRMVAAGLVPETGPDALQRMPVESAPAALAAVRDGGADYACVPIENSIDGSVLPTLDSLAIGVRLQVFAETTLDVTFSIVVKPGRNAADVRTLAAFPVAAAQVRQWLAAHLPAADLRPAYSNADAARQVADGLVDAAVTSPLAAARWGLAALADGVVDESNARTRFVLVGRPGPPPARTGADRTSAVLRIDNQPGALVAALAEFGIRGIDLTRIESRPTRTELGTYLFFVDCVGHIDDEAVAEALKACTAVVLMCDTWGLADGASGRGAAAPGRRSITLVSAAPRGQTRADPGSPGRPGGASMSGRLVLLRHGQSYGNVERRLDTLPPGTALTPLGRDQARAFARSGCRRPALLAHSVAIRAYQTAAVVAAELDMVAHEVAGIHEVQVGELENRNDDEAVAEFNATYSRWHRGELDVPLPGGETANDVLDRYLPVLADLRMRYLDDGDWDGDIVVVSHSAAIRLAAAVLAGVDGNFVLDNHLENVESVVLAPITDGRWSCVQWGLRKPPFCPDPAEAAASPVTHAVTSSTDPMG